VVLNLGKSLNDGQNKITIVTARAPRTLSKAELIDGLTVNRLFLGLPTASIKAFLAFPFFGLTSTVKLLQLIKRDRIDVLNLHFVDDAGFYSLIVKLLTGVKLITSLHGNDVQKFPQQSFFRKVLLRFVLSLSDKVTVNSNYILEEVCKMFPWVRSKVTVIGNGINLDEYVDAKPYLSTQTYVLSLGRLVHKKGIDILLRAWSKIKTDVSLIIAGDGEERQNLENLSKSLNLTNKVTFLGKVDHPTALSLFAGAEFFVLPSRIEPFGIVLLEAMASNCPIIASATGGIVDLVKDGQTGILFRSEDEADLTSKLQFMLDDIASLKNLTENATGVVKDYSWQSVARKYLEIYNS